VESKLPEMLKLVYLAVRPEDKLAALLCLLKQVIGPKEQTAIFAATKHHVEYISQVCRTKTLSRCSSGIHLVFAPFLRCPRYTEFSRK